MGREALGNAEEGLVRREPLTHRQALVIIEQLYDLVLEVDQKRRDQPPPEEEEEFALWYAAIFVWARYPVCLTGLTFQE